MNYSKLAAEMMADAVDSNIEMAQRIMVDPSPLKPRWWQFWLKAAYKRDYAVWWERQPKTIRIPHFNRVTRP